MPPALVSCRASFFQDDAASVDLRIRLCASVDGVPSRRRDPSDVFSQESTLHAENAEPITAAEAWSVQKTRESRDLKKEIED